MSCHRRRRLDPEGQSAPYRWRSRSRALLSSAERPSDRSFFDLPHLDHRLRGDRTGTGTTALGSGEDQLAPLWVGNSKASRTVLAMTKVRSLPCGIMAGRDHTPG